MRQRQLSCLLSRIVAIERDDAGTRDLSVLQYYIEQHVDRAVFFDGVPEMLVVDHVIVIASPNAFALNMASIFQVLNDALHSSLGDANSVGNIPEHHLRVLVQTDQHVGVIGEERPPRRLAAGWWGYLARIPGRPLWLGAPFESPLHRTLPALASRCLLALSHTRHSRANIGTNRHFAIEPLIIRLFIPETRCRKVFTVILAALAEVQLTNKVSGIYESCK